MFKTKMMMGIVAMAAVFIVSAVPASAWLRSNSLKTTGAIKTYPEETTFTPGPGLASITCVAKNSEGKLVASGEWEIQSGQEQAKGSFQPAALKGPHLQLKFSKWGVCKAATLSGESSIKVKCALQIVQQIKATGEQKVTGGPYPPGCVVTLGSEATHCIVNVAVQGNQGLSEVLLKGSQNEIEIGSKIAGIRSTTEETNEECKILKIAGGQEGTFKTSTPLIAEGLQLE